MENVYCLTNKVLLARSQNYENRLSASSCLSVRPRGTTQLSSNCSSKSWPNGLLLFLEPETGRLSNEHNSSLRTSPTTRDTRRRLRKIKTESAAVFTDSPHKKHLCDKTETVVLMKRKTKLNEGQATLPPPKQIPTTAIKLKPLSAPKIRTKRSVSSWMKRLLRKLQKTCTVRRRIPLWHPAVA